MIDQLWYTWALRGLEDPGLQLRAASQGLKSVQSPRYRALKERFFGYSLPRGLPANALVPKDAPLCLSFLREKEQDEQGPEKRVLVAKRFAGLDPFKRSFHFVHLVAEVPTSFSARDAIQCWRSPFWCYAEDDPACRAQALDDTTLRQIPEEHLKGTLIPEAEAKRCLSADPNAWASVVEVQDALPFVIQAFLLLGPKQRLYIADTPDRVAALIRGLTESLPVAFLDRLTFSTYEYDVEKSQAQIVGTYWPDIEKGIDQDTIPALAYTSSSAPALAIHCYIPGKRSPLDTTTAVAAFAQYAAQHFSRSNHLIKIRQIAEQYPNDFPTLPLFLERLANLYTGRVDFAQLTEEQLILLLKIPELADDFLSVEAVQQLLLAYIQRAPAQQWTKTGEPLIQQLAERAAAPGSTLSGLRAGLARLGPKAMSQAIETIRANRPREAIRWLRLAWYTTPPEQMADPWLALLNALPSFGSVSFSWEVISFLLGVWGTLARRQVPINISLFRSWLEVSWDQLEELFDLDLPDDWYTVSLENLLGSTAGDPTQGALRQRNPRLEAMLLKFVKNPQQHSLAIKLFQRMVRWGYEARLAVLLSILLDVRNQPSVAGAFLRLARLTARELLSLFTGPLAPFPHDALVEMVLADPAWWEPAGKRLIQDASALGDARLAQALTTLGSQTEQRLVRAIQDSDEQMVPFLVDVLALVRPPVTASDLWLGIYTQVPKPPATLSWRARSRLLAQWKAIVQRFESKDLSVWLAITWDEVGELLRDLPAQWRLLALAQLLRRPLSELPATIGQIVDDLESALEPLLASLLSNKQEQPSVVAFFAEVVRRGHYRQKMRMLGALLTAASADPQVMEELLKAAQLTPEDAASLVETCSTALLTPPILSPTYLQWVAYYLNHLTERNSTRLAALSYQPIQQLAEYAYSRLPGGAALHGVLDRLAALALNETATALHAGSEQAASFWMSLLAIKLDKARQQGEWLTLLHQTGQPGEGISSDLRLYLLGRWAPFEQQIAPHEIDLWLIIDWQSIDALMQQTQPAGPFPVVWCEKALRIRIARQREPLLPAEAQVVKTHFPKVAPALLALIAKPGRQEYVVAFLEKLAQAKIRRRIDVLADLLIQVAPEQALAERLLQAALPNPAQAAWLRQYRLPVMQSYQHISPDFLAWLEEKLIALAQERQTMSQSAAPGQPSDRQEASPTHWSRVKGWAAGRWKRLPGRRKSSTGHKPEHAPPAEEDFPKTKRNKAASDIQSSQKTPPAARPVEQQRIPAGTSGYANTVPHFSRQPPIGKYVPGGQTEPAPAPLPPARGASASAVGGWSSNTEQAPKKSNWLLVSAAAVVLILAILAIILIVVGVIKI